MIEVSVIVPNYNHGNYLKERIESILNQTFQNFELIILDDNSMDNSREIIEDYRQNPRVSAIEFNPVNSGSPFKQWAKGINMARGAFIWIAESDDSCEPVFLEKTVGKLNEYPSAGLVFSQSTEFHVETGKEFISFADHSRFANTFRHSYFNNGRQEISQKLVYENTIPNTSGVLFRKSVYQQTGGVDENMKLCGDWFIWIKMLLVSDVYFIADPLNYFRLTPISARAKHSAVSTFHERLEILQYLSHNHIDGAGKSQVNLLKSLFNNYTLKNLGEPVEKVMQERKNIHYPRLKLVYAFMLSLFDRINQKFQPSKNLHGV